MQIQGIPRALTLHQLPDHRPEHRSPLSGRVAINAYPGLKHPTSQSGSTELAEVLRRGWLFGVTYHNMRGAIASATAAWPNLFSRCAAIHASTSGLNIGSAAKMSKHQTRRPHPC
jgi:hypothetical protein